MSYQQRLQVATARAQEGLAALTERPDVVALLHIDLEGFLDRAIAYELREIDEELTAA